MKNRETRLPDIDLSKVQLPRDRYRQQRENDQEIHDMFTRMMRYTTAQLELDYHYDD